MLRTRALLPVCSVLALALLSGAEILGFGPRPSSWVLYAFGLLALAVATVHGLLWELLIAAAGRLPPRVRLLFWLALALVWGTLQAQALNAFRRLTGRYALQAAAVLSVAVAGSVLIGLIAHGMDRARGFLFSSAPLARGLAAFSLSALAAALFWADWAVYPGLYPQAHLALKLGAWWLLMFALALLARRFEQRWPLPLLLLLIVGASMAPQRYRFASKSFEGLFGHEWGAFVIELARDATDVDFDGHSSLFDGGDCQAWNPAVHPGRREIPGNGVDDNCILGDAVARSRVHTLPPVPRAPSPLNVVLITCDALRPDHLGVYDRRYGPKGRATSPAIDAFARGAVVFERAHTPGGGTSVALASMLRGMFPRRLRWTRHYETSHNRLVQKPDQLRTREHVTSMFPLAYDDPRLPLPAWLQRRGMYTVAVLDDGYSEMLGLGTGVETGFAAFFSTDSAPYGSRNDIGTADNVVRALAGVPAGKRFFLWAHFFGAHGPNEEHPGARRYGDSLADGYDHEISFLDLQLARVFRALEPLLPSTAVFVTADHGDVLENGRYHGYSLSDDVARVPLIARVPGWQPARVRELTSLVDLLPTILELTATPAPAELDGLSLGRLVRGETPERLLFSDSWLFDAEGAARVDLTAAYDSRGKLIVDLLRSTRAMEHPSSARRAALERPRLERAVNAYLDETGGALQLSE